MRPSSCGSAVAGWAQRRSWTPTAPLRLLLPTPGWDELVDLARTEPRRHGAGTVQVARRLTALLDGLRAAVPEDRRPVLERHRARVAAAPERLYPDPHERACAATSDRLGSAAQ